MSVALSLALSLALDVPMTIGPHLTMPARAPTGKQQAERPRTPDHPKLGTSARAPGFPGMKSINPMGPLRR